MSEIICITNRSLCEDDFLKRIGEIAKEKPRAVILREKDLSKEEYRILAEAVKDICERYGVTCILHSHADVAKSVCAEGLHMPLWLLRDMTKEEKKAFGILGASCHSAEDAVEAERLGCTYITAGHVFDTDCKRGLPGRGLDFLKDVCKSVSIPVYAIGGICKTNYAKVRLAGARGACIMSGLMRCEDVGKFMEELTNED